MRENVLLQCSALDNVQRNMVCGVPRGTISWTLLSDAACCPKPSRARDRRSTLSKPTLTGAPLMKLAHFTAHAVRLGATMAAVASVLHGQSAPRGDVLILTTGGTIASRAMGPMTDGASLVRGIPELADVANIRVAEVMRVPSSQMTPADWIRVAKRINAEFGAAPALRGIVITHGTDTMEETAFFLNLAVHDPRPVVIVGSMRGADEVSADGPANILNGVRVAVSDDARGQGVLVVLNEDISAARDVLKTDNRRVETFRSPERGYLGAADPDSVVFFRRVLHPHTTATEFDVGRIEVLPPVEIITDYAGFDSTVMRSVIERRPAGVVLTSFAGGRLSAGARAAVRMAGAAGLPVVVASRVPGGRIVGDPLDDLPGIVARDLPSNKARVLLMLALTRTRERLAIQRIFERY
jgi:L-asparaginase